MCYLLFWYHVLTCVSVNWSFAASSILSCTLKYFCLSKLFSSVWSWWSVNAVLAFLCFLLGGELIVDDDDSFASSSLTPEMKKLKPLIYNYYSIVSHWIFTAIYKSSLGHSRSMGFYIYFFYLPSRCIPPSRDFLLFPRRWEADIYIYNLYFWSLRADETPLAGDNFASFLDWSTPRKSRAHEELVENRASTTPRKFPFPLKWLHTQGIPKWNWNPSKIGKHF